jgi:hypothetical protein
MDDIHFQYGDDTITIIQLQQLWMSNPDLILLVKDKVVGLPEDVANYDSSVNIDGYNYTTTMNDIYVEELTKYKDWLHETMALNAADSGNTFDTLLHLSGGNNNVKNNITSKLATLPYGKYLDVSDLNNMKVLGPNKNKFVGTKSRLMSTNYDSFFSALCSIEGGASRYAEDIRAAKKYFHITSSTQKEICTLGSAIDTTIPEKVTRTYVRQVKPKTFVQMLNSLRDNKVIDVSNIDDKGFDGVIVLRSDINNEFVAEKVPLISDNLDRFERAIFLLRGEERFKSDLIKARLHFNKEDATFTDILGTLKEGEVVDVSNITEDGADAFIISVDEIPHGYYKGREIAITSNNYEGFERAIMLIEGYFTYKSDLQRAKLYFDKGYLDVSKVTDDNVNAVVIDEEDIGDKYVSTVVNMVSDNLTALVKAYTLTGVDMEEFREDIELAKEYFGFTSELPERYMMVLNSNNKKYLDVSNIREDGTGIVIIDEKNIGDKYTAINVKIVSNNYEAFIKALMLLPNKDFFTYGDDIHFAKQYFGNGSSSSLENSL